MKRERRRHWLVRTLLRNVLPSYLGPAVMVSVNARMISDRATSEALADAAFTTIAIPSALAALAVSVVIGRRFPGVASLTVTHKVFRSAILAALTCGAFAAGISMILVGNGFAPHRLFLDAIPSAALGGAITAAQTARARGREVADRTASTPDDRVVGDHLETAASHVIAGGARS
jgi:hypothetical protein